jgi:hypothetical protein
MIWPGGNSRPFHMCTFESCERKVHAKGLCSAHYMQKRAGIELRPVRQSFSTEKDRKAGASVRSKRVHQKKVEMVNAIKAEQGCADCGESDPVVLEFDHVQTGKTANVAKLVYSASVQRILDEIRLCEVVCANCHRRRTANRRILAPKCPYVYNGI